MEEFQIWSIWSSNRIGSGLIGIGSILGVWLSMRIAVEKSNYSKVKKLSETFKKVCNQLCEENKSILETLANIEPKNDS